MNKKKIDMKVCDNLLEKLSLRHTVIFSLSYIRQLIVLKIYSFFSEFVLNTDYFLMVLAAFLW